MTIHFGGEEVELIAHPGGHSHGDIVVYFKESKVLQLSDLLFSIGFPAIDHERGGNVITFADHLKVICEKYSDDTIFVAGHGKEFSKKELRQYQEMIEGSAKVVMEAMIGGFTLEQIKQRKLLDKWRAYSHGYFSCNDWAEILFYSLHMLHPMVNFFFL